MKSTVVHEDSLMEAPTYPVPEEQLLTRKAADVTVHPIPENLTTIPVAPETLTTIPVNRILPNDTSHYLINTFGDKLPTGVPIRIEGKEVLAKQPKPNRALPSRFKDNVVNDMQYLDVDQGMASSYIRSILEDSQGNIWFGSYGGGVSKYDGASFTHYTEQEGLSNNDVRFILEDKAGNIWFATYGGGVCCYNGTSFIHFTEKQGFTSDFTYAMMEDNHGNIWFGTDDGGVSKYDGSYITHYTIKEGLSNNTVWSMLQDTDGNIWFGTFDGGLTKFDGTAFTHYTQKDGLPSNVVVSMMEDRKGNLWFGTDGDGLAVYDGKSFTHYTEKEGLSNNHVYTIHEDKNGLIWIGTYGGGVNKYDGTSFTHYTTAQGLSYDDINLMIEDGSGNLWFGTDGGGVTRYNNQSFAYYTESQGLSYNVVNAILEDHTGTLWFGTYDGGVTKYDGEYFWHFTVDDGLSNNVVWAITEDRNGNIWFGTYGGGVTKYDGKNFTHYLEEQGMSSNDVVSILEDRDGNLWFGTYGGGVTMYDGIGFTHYTEEEGLTSNDVVALLEDKHGNIWMGTNGGVTKYSGDTWTHYTRKEGLSNDYVNSITEDQHGNLWFGTQGLGLSKFDGKSFTHYTEKQGLIDNEIWSTLEDNNGNIWCSTEKGLTQLTTCCAAPNHTDSCKCKVISYSKRDGLKGIDFYPNSAYMDSENRIWWGNGKGLTMLDLAKHQTSDQPPAVRLKQLEINETFIDFRQISADAEQAIKFDHIPPFTNYPSGLELPYDKNHLNFQFIAIDWSAPHKIKYSYLLEGLNEKWSHPVSEGKADYRNIPPGSYTLKVRAIGESNEWSAPLEYHFTIHPPWWHTWWARSLYAITGIIIVLGFVSWRTAQLKKRQKELVYEVKAATKEIREQKEIAEQAHKEITDSLNYAERIQRSFMATEEVLESNLKDFFVYFNPKEAVSGDFYWAGKLTNGNFALCCADSTGHGVPGAIVSILNISAIERSIENGAHYPADIFNQARNTIIRRLQKDGSEEGGKDGMDGSLISLYPERNKMAYVAAQNPIWIIRDGKLIEIKPEKMPVGKHARDHIPFEGGEVSLKKGDIIYSMTDGFQDQFGGEKGKKFKPANFKRLLLTIHSESMDRQKELIEQAFEQWKGDLEQLDDVCVIGVRV